MTIEERERAIDALKISAPVMAVTQEEFNNYIQALNNIMDWLEQEPCNTDTCKVVKAYMNEWDKPNNSDAISRQAVLNLFNKSDEFEWEISLIRRKIEKLPPVIPQPKTAHWVEENVNGGRKVFCSECGFPAPFEHVSTGDVYSASGYGVINKTKFCPNCGFRMIEPLESEE